MTFADESITVINAAKTTAELDAQYAQRIASLIREGASTTSLAGDRRVVLAAAPALQRQLGRRGDAHRLHHPPMKETTMTTITTFDATGRDVDGHPSWCAEDQCMPMGDGSFVHYGTPRFLSPTLVDRLNTPGNGIEVAPTLPDGEPAAVYLVAGEGALTPDEARELAAHLTAAADLAEVAR